MTSEITKKELNVELLEKVKSSLNSMPLSLPDGTRLSIDKFGGVSVYGPQKHPNSVSDTDDIFNCCLLYTSPSPRDRQKSRMPSSA